MDRIRQVLIACVAALVLSQIFLRPLDELTWHSQARIGEQQASGEIVFVSANENITEPNNPEGRLQLADALVSLNTAGVKRVFLDMQLDRPSQASADEALHDAISALGARVALVNKVVTSPGGGDDLVQTIPKIAGNAAAIPNNRFVDYLGYTWSMPLHYKTGQGIVATLPAALAGVANPQDSDVDIIYSFAPSSIPIIDLAKLQPETLRNARQGGLSDLAGKIVIIGQASPSANTSKFVANIPGQVDLPTSYISIYAAETLKAGFPRQIGPLQTFLGYLISLLCIAAISSRTRLRHFGYTILFLSLPVITMLFANLGMKAYLSTSIALLAIYGGLRMRDRWQNRFALMDQTTKLPTFRALEQLLDKGSVSDAIVIAKIHRLDEVLSTLPEALHAEYTLRITERLKAANRKLPVYTNGGRYLAWLTSETDMTVLDQHLRGMRALFTQPLVIGDTHVDVGITFGVDRTRGAKGRQRVAFALTAAESSSEAHRPVSIAEETSESDRLWNISLQSKIDSALSKGEIYVVFQPQVSLHHGTIVGAEALVRWEDPLRGTIAPTYFIEQCEMAGRMEHLTQHVLNEAIYGFMSLGDWGRTLSLSVNISATMLHDSNIQQIISDVLAETGFNPRQLVLEITETSKIADPGTALAIIEQFKLRGIRISLDDFGVGTASLETFLDFPFDELKIDRSFVDALQHSGKARAIVKNLLAMGRESRITVVAEGVENDHTLNILSGFGADYVQGYAISRPLPLLSFKEFQWVRDIPPKKNMV